MTIHSLALVLALGFQLTAQAIERQGAVAPVAGSSLNEAAPTDATAIYWQAAKLDRLGDSKPVPGIPGGYVSPFGTQIHPSCFDYAEQSGVKRADAEAKAEAWLRESFNTMVGCESRYPELKPYLSEWVSQFRRARITCTGKTGANSHMSGQNMALGIGLWAGLSDSEREGIEVPDGLGSLPRQYRSVIIIPRDIFQDGLGNGADKSADGNYSRDVIFHEVLHSTHANNRWDHDTVENSKPSSRTACDDDYIVADRINVVSTLCTQLALYDGKSAERLLFDRMSNCGVAKCVSVFGDDHYDTHNVLDYLVQPWMPTQGLGLKNAERLCKRIYVQGQCNSDLERDGKSLTASAPKLRELGARMRERLHHLFVAGAARLSPEILAAAPGGAALLKLRDTACFKSAFTMAKNGAIYPAARTPVTHVAGETATPRRYFMDSQRALEKAVTAAPGCAGAQGNAITQALGHLTAEVDWSLFRNSAYERFIERRYEGQAEEDPAGFSWAFRDTPWTSLLDKELVGDYAKALDSLHYKSSNVSCEALGYSGVERALPVFKAVAVRAQMKNKAMDCSK